MLLFLTPGTLGVAVNVTDCPTTAGFGDIETVVVVAESALTGVA
jgi:hypothetical protein